jgi:hypothetical protein
MKAKRKRTRRRANPAGGFWVGVMGFLVVPMAAYGVKKAANAVGGITNCGTRMTASVVVDAATGVSLWAARDAVRDPGWRSFMLGGVIVELVATVAGPVGIFVEEKCGA